MAYLLHQLLTASALQNPDHDAAVCRDLAVTYGDLDVWSNRVAAVLRSQDVKKGDRIGIYVPKSLASLVSIFGILKSGACYVPLDPTAPLERLAYIIRDSGITVLMTSAARVDRIRDMFPEACPLRSVILVDCDLPAAEQPQTATVPDTVSLISWKGVLEVPEPTRQAETAIETDTAYILYTSGSTGTPKGVMISHRNSLTFVDWAADFVGLTSEDRVSSHAPLHFDLSIFDIFASCRAGATIILIPEGGSTFPKDLAQHIENKRITVWYSVPSALTLLVLYGDLGARDLGALHTIIFAGEVFPTKHLRSLMSLIPHARYLNWYGPTETNVCTYYEVPVLDPDRTEPVPIGKACANSETFVVNASGQKVSTPGESGELYARGPTVMQGYWGAPEMTATRLVCNPFQRHFEEFVYRTGDVVRIDGDGNYIYLGREDGMVKTRGYRVELGEIEVALYELPAVREAVVLPVPHDVFGNLLRAVISLNEGYSLSREDVTGYCTKRLPRYMVPEVVEFREELPKTSTGKTDRVALAGSTSHAAR